MLRSRAFGALILLTLLYSNPSPASAAGPWICMHSANFELYTTAGEKTGREALLRFEEIRSAFSDIVGVKLPQKGRSPSLPFAMSRNTRHTGSARAPSPTICRCLITTSS